VLDALNANLFPLGEPSALSFFTEFKSVICLKWTPEIGPDVKV
jgi:hypothetical protein